MRHSVLCPIRISIRLFEIFKVFNWKITVAFSSYMVDNNNYIPMCQNHDKNNNSNHVDKWKIVLFLNLKRGWILGTDS